MEHFTHVFSRVNGFNAPVLHLPSKEFSVAVRFSPVKYALRNKDASSSSSKPWLRIRTLFQLPYRMVYAVATRNAVAFYDTQQAEPFARVSNIHYIGLTDLTWSPDGRTLVVSSTDGFCSVVSFDEDEIGQVYEDGDKENDNMEVDVDPQATKTSLVEPGAANLIAVKKKPTKDEAREATTIQVRKTK